MGGAGGRGCGCSGGIRLRVGGGVERLLRRCFPLFFLLREIRVVVGVLVDALEPLFGLDDDDGQVHENEPEHAAADPQHVDGVCNAAAQRRADVDEGGADPAALVEACEAGGEGGEGGLELVVGGGDGGDDGVDGGVHGGDVGENQRVGGAELRGEHGDDAVAAKAREI